MNSFRSWFTADPHFDHKRIIELCQRPFDNVDEMNEALVASYNSLIHPNDHLYILGDFAWGDADNVRRWRNRLRCRNIFFVMGNHDHALSKDKHLQRELFNNVYDIKIIKVENQDIALCHYPMLEWPKFFHGAWHLFGHVHGNLSPMPGHLACDVGVDCHGYKPVSFEELKVIMSRRQDFNAKSMDDGLKERD